MKKNQKEVVKAVAVIVVVGIFFIISSLIVNHYIEPLKKYSFENYYYGVLIYIFIATVSIVIAPVSSMPLIPFASLVWGWKLAALYSIIGWTLGETITFWLARKYGKPIIKKLISLKEVERFEKFIPDHHIFASIVLLRIVLPTDGLGYALGLFSNVKMKPYVIATILGTIPFAIIFTYLGTLNVLYQIIGFVVAFILVGSLLTIGYHMKKKEMNKKKNF